MLFGDSEDKETATNRDKMHIGKQICRTVAHLHNLKTPTIHRDIKPENVMVATAAHTTKLCDMGLGKLKSAQSGAQKTSQSVPGTPLLERKKQQPNLMLGH